MTGTADLPESTSKPPAGRSRRSPTRRSQRPATDGVPEGERELVTAISDEAAADHPLDDDSVAGKGGSAKRSSRPAGAGSDAWWQEQRPPHWG
ncbi:MAG: hypothetical protein WA966_15230 [Ornithinimicrobium sp.]